MKVSYALKLLREYIIWPQMKILDVRECVLSVKNFEGLLVIVINKNIFIFWKGF